jgi:hypothetical protein
MLDLGEPARDRDGHTPRYPGNELEIGGTRIIIPFRTIGYMKAGCAAREVLRQAQTAGNFDTIEAIDATTELAFLALRSNYPQLSKESIEDNFDDEDLRKIVEVALKRRGEAPAAPMAAAINSTTSPVNGTPSPSSSVESSDGPGTTLSVN